MKPAGIFFKPPAHGTYFDDILFGLVFVVGVLVFLYFFFSDPGDSDDPQE